jgi:hypothetical protein
VQYRTEKAHCVVRFFAEHNGTIMNDPLLHNLKTGGLGSEVKLQNTDVEQF